MGMRFRSVERLTSNRKLVYVASGMGAQLAAAMFRTAPTDAPR